MSDSASSTGSEAGAVRGGESVLARATRLLVAFDEIDPELTLTDLVERTRLPTTTVHRLAAELTGLGLLDREGRRYRIGRRLWELGELAGESLGLRELALPHLLTLYESTGENVHMAVLAGHEALYVARLIGPRSVPTVSRMGGRLPLHTTGVGKVLLAFRPDSDVEAYLRRDLERPTKYSVVSPQRLRAQVAEIRERGYAVTSQEMTLGNVSVAVPVDDGAGTTIAAVGLVTHLARGGVSRLVPVLRRAARGIADERFSL